MFEPQTTLVFLQKFAARHFVSLLVDALLVGYKLLHQMFRFSIEHPIFHDIFHTNSYLHSSNTKRKKPSNFPLFTNVSPPGSAHWALHPSSLPSLPTPPNRSRVATRTRSPPRRNRPAPPRRCVGKRFQCPANCPRSKMPEDPKGQINDTPRERPPGCDTGIYFAESFWKWEDHLPKVLEMKQDAVDWWKMLTTKMNRPRNQQAPSQWNVEGHVGDHIDSQIAPTAGIRWQSAIRVRKKEQSNSAHNGYRHALHHEICE